MASIVSAGTTSATALNMSADTTGILQLASNNGTVALTIDASQTINLGATSNVFGSKFGVTSTSAFPIAGITSAVAGSIFQKSTSGAGNQLMVLSGNSFNYGVVGVSSADGTANGDVYTLGYTPSAGSTATQVANWTSTGLFQFNSGYGSSATAYGCRAWVNFNGQGTVAIRASGNVSSITDNAVGNYTINFTTALPNANYAIGSSFQRVDETGQFLNLGFSNSTSNFGIEAFRAGSNTNTAVLADFATLSLVVMR